MTTSASGIVTTTPWVEKYRPQKLEDVVYHDHIITILRNFISRGEESTSSSSIPHLFMYGSPGTGKTSTILTCAREMYGAHTPYMVLHLNASDDRGVDTVRKQIIQFASTDNLYSLDQPKLVILDEADSMTEEAQVALNDVLVKFNDNVRFCFIGNYQYSLLPTLRSRLVKLIFTPLPLRDARIVLEKVAVAEGLEITDGAMTLIHELSGGDLRRCINLLQSVGSLSSSNIIDEATISRKELTQKRDAYDKLSLRMRHDSLNAAATVEMVQEHIYSSNSSFVTFVDEFTDYIAERLPDDRLRAQLFKVAAVVLLNSCHLVDHDHQIRCFAMVCHKFCRYM